MMKITTLASLVAFSLANVTLPCAADTFAMNIFQQIAKEKAKENFVLSGESIESVLMMLQYGATGTTQQELSKALCGQSQMCDSGKIASPEAYLAANAVWVQQGLPINPTYVQDIEQRFKAAIESVNFQKDRAAAANKINTWAKKNTQGMIEKILEPTDIEANTALILANALFFQGFWPTQFDPKKTTDLEFTMLSGKKQNVPTMVKEDQYFVAKQNHTQLIGLPYRDSNLEMLVIMPEDPKQYKQFVQSLTNQTIKSLVKAQKQTKATLYLPKFSVSSSYSNLKPNLQALGIKKVFSNNAELNKITDKVPLILSRVLQKAVIEVDERGTKAAAVTAGIVLARAVLVNNIHVDHPFVFAIYDQKTQKIPFIGQVVNPVG